MYMLPMDVLKSAEMSSNVFVSLNKEERFAVCSAVEITLFASTAKFVGFSFS